MARAYGLDLSHLPDDQSAQHYLMTQAAQQSQLARYGEHYLQHAAQFEDYLRTQRQAEAQRQQQAQQKWWNPPEYDPSWERLVKRNEQTGELEGPPDVLAKFRSYHQYRQNFAEKFLSNPAEALRPFVQEEATRIAQGLVQQHLSGYQEQNYANSFVNQNASWLFQHDAQGNRLQDPRTGGPAMTPEGARFREYVVQAEKIGVRDITQQEAYARALLQRDLLMAQQQRLGQTQGAAQTQQAANRQFLEQNNRRPSASGAQAPVRGKKPVLGGGKSLADRLRGALKEEGVTDADLAADKR